VTRAGLALALLIAVYGALLFADLIGQAVNNFRRDTTQAHGLTSSDDDESAARETFFGGTQAGGGNLVRLHLQISSRFLSSGSERPL
jgi:hypothetical protein